MATLYTKDQFKNCVFNPLVNGSILVSYPELSASLENEWLTDVNFDSIMRYAIAMYDPKSPLVLREKDMNRRKDAACELFGLTDPSEITWIGILVFTYLKDFVRSRDWATICALEFSYWESIQILMQPINGKNDKETLESVQKKNTIKDKIEEDLARLDRYYDNFFSGDKVIEEQIKKQRITPESIAGYERL